MKISTIGFTKKNADQFFGLLREENVKTLIDVRLNNVSQLAGFAKRDDLKFFLKELCQAEYVHEPKLAPTKDSKSCSSLFFRKSRIQNFANLSKKNKCIFSQKRLLHMPNINSLEPNAQ